MLSSFRFRVLTLAADDVALIRVLALEIAAPVLLFNFFEFEGHSAFTTIFTVHVQLDQLISIVAVDQLLLASASLWVQSSDFMVRMSSAEILSSFPNRSSS